MTGSTYAVSERAARRASYPPRVLRREDQVLHARVTARPEAQAGSRASTTSQPSARPDARASSGTRHRSPGFNVGRQDVELTPCRMLREFAPNAVVAHRLDFGAGSSWRARMILATSPRSLPSW
jgi:hypothetical protein